MKNCSEVNKLITLYIDDKLGSNERAKFDEHIKNCESCRRELEEILQVASLCTSISEEELPDAFKEQLHKKLVAVDKTISGENNGKVLFFNRRYLKIASSIAAILLMAVILRGVFGNNLFIGKSSTKSDMSGARTEMAQNTDAVAAGQSNQKSLNAESKDSAVQGILSMNNTNNDLADQADKQKKADDQSRMYKTADAQMTKAQQEFKDIDIVIKTDNPQDRAIKIKQDAEAYGALTQKSKFEGGYGGREETEVSTADSEDTVQLYFKIPNSNYEQFINVLKSEFAASSDIDFSQMNVVYATAAIENLAKNADELEQKINELETSKDKTDSQDMDQLKIQRDSILADMERIQRDSEYTIVSVKLIKKAG